MEKEIPDFLYHPQWCWLNHMGLNWALGFLLQRYWTCVAHRVDSAKSEFGRIWVLFQRYQTSYITHWVDSALSLNMDQTSYIRPIGLSPWRGLNLSIFGFCSEIPDLLFGSSGWLGHETENWAYLGSFWQYKCQCVNTYASQQFWSPGFDYGLNFKCKYTNRWAQYQLKCVKSGIFFSKSMACWGLGLFQCLDRKKSWKLLSQMECCTKFSS